MNDESDRRSHILMLHGKLAVSKANVDRAGANVSYTSHSEPVVSILAVDGTVALRPPDGYREQFLSANVFRLTGRHGPS